MSKLVHKKRRGGGNRKKGGGSKRGTTRAALTAAQLVAKKRKIAALREMTVERGCTPGEAANARERLRELEAQVAHAEAGATVAAASAVKDAARKRKTKHRIVAPVNPDSCAARVGPAYVSTMDDLRAMFDGMRSDDDEAREEAHTRFCEYGLSFDYVAPGTFGDQREGYFRYQLSWGGPSDEIRFYVRREDYPTRGYYGDRVWRSRFVVERVEYWFMDWWDGAKIDVTGSDLDLLKEVFDWFEECGSTSAEYEKAMADEDVEP